MPSEINPFIYFGNFNLPHVNCMEGEPKTVLFAEQELQLTNDFNYDKYRFRNIVSIPPWRAQLTYGPVIDMKNDMVTALLEGDNHSDVTLHHMKCFVACLGRVY